MQDCAKGRINAATPSLSTKEQARLASECESWEEPGAKRARSAEPSATPADASSADGGCCSSRALACMSASCGLLHHPGRLLGNRLRRANPRPARCRKPLLRNAGAEQLRSCLGRSRALSCPGLCPASRSRLLPLSLSSPRSSQWDRHRPERGGNETQGPAPEQFYPISLLPHAPPHTPRLPISTGTRPTAELGGEEGPSGNHLYLFININSEIVVIQN
nr:uncharacterized protein LOC112995559 [Dromaius novaehollandiae]